jgi:tetratricopeptide (TPR) repeat protein
VDARPIAQRLLEKHPEDVELLMLSATACAESGDPASGLSMLETARRVAPMRAEVHQKIGDIAESLGDIEGAIAAYRHALQLDRDFAVVRFHLAQLLQKKGKNREAELELITALDAVPTYAEATLELANLRRRLGRPTESLTLLVDLLQRCSSTSCSAIRITSTRCSRSERRCSRSDESATRSTHSRGCCASTRRTLARCSTRARCSWSSIATATRSIGGNA